MKSVAVIGSGVMGAGIAAHIANANIEVFLYDIASHEDRNHIPNLAIEKIKTHPSPLTHPDNIRYIKACNLEDDLDHLSSVDWIIEAIVEKLEIKIDLYKKIERYSAKDCIISSNTSTIKLDQLTKEFDESFKSRFLITHFFNPPRYMRLVEVIKGNISDFNLNKILDFLDISLGKEVIFCNDTPGFIANRIGCYFMIVGLIEALRLNIKINEADIVASCYGIPKTGIFGLFDLIGIDVMVLIAKSLAKALPEEDDFNLNYKSISLLEDMISKNMLGRKSKSGFYKFDKINNRKEILDLKTFNYIAEDTSDKPILSTEKLKDLFESQDSLANYAKIVISKTINYAAELIPSVTDDITAIDKALKLGFNWKYGIFELADMLGGASNIAKHIKKPSEIIDEIGRKSFYKKESGKKFYYSANEYRPIEEAKEKLSLEDIKEANKPIYKNNSSALWDIGDEVICFEITSKAGSLDYEVFSSLNHICDNILQNYKGMVIAGNSNMFSAGANLNFLLELIEAKKFDEIKSFIEFGQKTMLSIKYSSNPIIAAAKNLALGGGCELIMHSTDIESHVELYTGLVEVNVGLVPAWGGCKELIMRASNKEQLIQAFNNTLYAKTSTSAVDAKEMNIVRNSNITMNIDRLLADAKKQVINYKAQDKIYNSSKIEVKDHLEDIIKSSNQLSEYNKFIVSYLIEIFSSFGESEIMQKELDVFMELVKNSKTKERIIHMIKTGKPLRN